MKRLVLGAVLLCAACDEAQFGQGGVSVGRASAFQEFLVIGSAMSFDECRAQGGLIIRDNGSPMTACDPTVIGKIVPTDEFSHPDNQAAATAGL